MFTILESENKLSQNWKGNAISDNIIGSIAVGQNPWFYSVNDMLQSQLYFADNSSTVNLSE